MLNGENRGNILYVEDNPDNRLLIRRILGSEGFTIYEAESATKALDVLQNIHPDLILMDINLPEMEGYHLTANIRLIPGMKTVPIIAITANVLKGDREKSLEAGCDGYIQKPIDIDMIADQIDRFMKR